MDVLVVVDMQKDFISGALGTKEASAIVPHVAEKIAQGIELENIELQRELEKSGVIELTVTN